MTMIRATIRTTTTRTTLIAMRPEVARLFT